MANQIGLFDIDPESAIPDALPMNEFGGATIQDILKQVQGASSSIPDILQRVGLGQLPNFLPQVPGAGGAPVPQAPEELQGVPQLEGPEEEPPEFDVQGIAGQPQVTPQELAPPGLPPERGEAVAPSGAMEAQPDINSFVARRAAEAGFIDADELPEFEAFLNARLTPELQRLRAQGNQREIAERLLPQNVVPEFREFQKQQPGRQQVSEISPATAPFLGLVDAPIGEINRSIDQFARQQAASAIPV